MEAKRTPLFKKNMTLSQAYNRMTQRVIFEPNTPTIIWAFENPMSPFALPGSIDLLGHDYLHCILNQPMTLSGEAYVLGFTMGADSRTRPWHVWLMKFVGRFLYPEKYRFKAKHLPIFDHALALGRKSRLQDLDRVDFTQFAGVKLADLRALFGVSEVMAQP